MDTATIEMVLVGGAVLAALTALCLARPGAGRVTAGLFFIPMALIHVGVALVNPQLYVTYVEGAFVPVWRDLALALIRPAPALFGAAMFLYEVAVALLVLGRGRAVTLGLAGMILFLIVIVPLGPETALTAPILAAGLATLLPRCFDATFPALVRARLRQRRPAAPSRPIAAR